MIFTVRQGDWREKERKRESKQRDGFISFVGTV